MRKFKTNFDEKEYMVTKHTASKQGIYHSKLADCDVHEVFASTKYATELMLVEGDYESALKIFNRIIPLQDNNPNSPSCGVWPYFLEESVQEMDRPDYNMADFNAKELVCVMIKARDLIDADTAGKMLDAINLACQCIIRRNEGVQYTNIAIMDTLVTGAGGELLNNEEYINYGRNKIVRFLEFVRGHHSVLEYNSPRYSIITANDLGAIFELVKDDKILKYAAEANEMIWRIMAEHFDCNNLQLTGPHARAYADFTEPEFIKAIGDACGIDFTKHEKFYYYFSEEDAEKIKRDSYEKPVCPQKYLPYFTGEKKKENIREMTMDGFNYPYFAFAQAATTYRCDSFSVGTMNREEFWNQRRPLISYIKGNEKDCCFRVKCCHDGYDYASAILHSVQEKGNILGNINFSIDRGDTHISSNTIKDASISAEDFRVNFEFTIDNNDISYKNTDNGVVFVINGVSVRINVFIKEFGEHVIKEEIVTENNRLKYSIVLYNGEREILRFDEMKKAFIGFTIEMGELGQYNLPQIKERETTIDTAWLTNGTELSLSSLKKPAAFIQNMYEDKQMINGVDIMKPLFNLSLSAEG